MRRLFPDDDPTHVNLDALVAEKQHIPSLLHKGETAPPASAAQPQTSMGPGVPQARPTAAVYSRLLGVIKPHAEDQQKWDVWAEEEDSIMTEGDMQVLEHILCFCIMWVGLNGCYSVYIGSAVLAAECIMHHTHWMTLLHCIPFRM